MDRLQSQTKNICILQETQERWEKIFKEDASLYLYAMTGYGKSTQAVAFAKAHYQEWERLSAADDGFMESLEQVMLKYAKPRTRTLLILDDLQWIFDEGDRQRLFELLIQMRRNRKLHIFLISRAAVPSYLAPLQVTRQLVVEDQESLKYHEADIRKVMQTYPGLEIRSEAWQDKMIKISQEVAKGYPLGTNAFLQRLEKQPDDPQTATTLAIQDIYDFLSINLFDEWTADRREAVINLSVYEQFDLDMAKRLLGEQAEAMLQDFGDVGSFLLFKAPDTYWMVSFFRNFLEAQLAKKPKEEWISLYETAAGCYEQKRNYEQALRCWKKAKRQDKIVELVVYLSENAEGCTFAHIAQQYINEIPLEWEQREPRLVGAKVMLAAYRMQPEECVAHLERLKQMADAEHGRAMRGGALAAYVRTVIACPYDTADELKDNMLKFAEYVRKNGFHLKNIMPTGNMPSVINGGLDLLPWEKNKKILYPIIKAASELTMGKEAVGIADASMGEILYEQNQATKAMSYLTKALSSANCKGSIRVQYAATAIMAKLFLAEGQSETAEEILENVEQKVEEEQFHELLPNIQATIIYHAMLRQDSVAVEEWLRNEAPDEHAEFYITLRYQLLMKARAYTSLGKTIEALHILLLLEEFATLYQRTFFHIEVLVLKAILLYRREEEWQETLAQAVRSAQPYHLIRVFADQGAALLPLWKSFDWETQNLTWDKANIVTKEMKQMAAYYPNYLKVSSKHAKLSKKEQEVLQLMAEGYNNSQIAKQMQVNLGTVKFHVGNIMKKLEAENRTVAVKTAQDDGLL